MRAEAGRLWTDLVTVRTQRRTEGRSLDAGEREQATTGGQYPLQSQSVQALCQKFAANMETATNSAGRSWLKADPSRRRIRTTSKSTRR